MANIHVIAVLAMVVFSVGVLAVDGLTHEQHINDCDYICFSDAWKYNPDGSVTHYKIHTDQTTHETIILEAT